MDEQNTVWPPIEPTTPVQDYYEPTAHAPNPYEDAIPIPPPPPHLTKKPRKYLGVLLIIAILLFSASAGVFFLARSFTVDFFFQAEDGIRDLYVTGVKTCALPI